MSRRLVLLCHANIARSAAAGLLAGAMLGERSDWTVLSRGTHARPGARIDRTIGGAVHALGVATGAHRSTQATPDDLREADLVLAFEGRQRAWALQCAPTTARTTFTIRRAAALLAAGGAAALASDNDQYTPADDFADPFGKGPAAAAQAVTEIDALLRSILPAVGAIDATALPVASSRATRWSARHPGTVLAPTDALEGGS